MGSSSKRQKRDQETEIDSEYESESGDELLMVAGMDGEGNFMGDYPTIDDDDGGGGEEEEEEEEEQDCLEDDEYEDDGKGWVEDGEDSGFDNEPDTRKLDVEMEELEKEYRELKTSELNMVENLKRHKDDDLLKGQAVKNQKALWDKSLEFRFLLQKAFSNSNRLPQEPILSSFFEADESVKSSYSDVIAASKKAIDSLLELQEALLENNTSITQVTEGGSGSVSNGLRISGNADDGSDEEWSRISNMHSRIAPFRNKSVDKWQRKTEVNTGAAAKKSKLLAFNQNISDQVATYMRDPSKMIKGMQMRRGTVAVFGSIDELGSITNEDVKTDGDPELLNDSEFYQQLLKEFFETIDPNSAEAAVYALKRVQTRKRKLVDRRASKSRKIRYHVHEKLVNFMAPQHMDLPPMAPKLFANLFGLKTRKPSTVA